MIHQAEAWVKYIDWEKTNPLVRPAVLFGPNHLNMVSAQMLTDKIDLVNRVKYAYQMCLRCMSFRPKCVLIMFLANVVFTE